MRLAFAISMLLAALPAAAAADAVGRQDDAFHFAAYAADAQASAYAEWWYFNLSDPAHGLQLAVTYTIIDPANRSGFGTAAMTAIGYTAAGHFAETNTYSPDAFSASDAQADVSIVQPSSPPNFVQVLSDDVYRVTGAVHGEHSVSWDLFYVRQLAPWFGLDRRHVGILPWEQMSWLQYMPGAAVSGAVTIDGTRYPVIGARGYHDHNWGEWVPFDVTWNWAQFFGPGMALTIGDFRDSGTGAVSIQRAGGRTTFTKGQYSIVHSGWIFDADDGVWYPTDSWLIAKNDTSALLVDLQAIDTVPVLPPPNLPLPLVPVIFEQTAGFRGVMWEMSPGGAWSVVDAFAGGGFKEYTGVGVPRQQP